MTRRWGQIRQNGFPGNDLTDLADLTFAYLEWPETTPKFIWVSDFGVKSNGLLINLVILNGYVSDIIDNDYNVVPFKLLFSDIADKH